jgi:hypothetical protein
MSVFQLIYNIPNNQTSPKDGIYDIFAIFGHLTYISGVSVFLVHCFLSLYGYFGKNYLNSIQTDGLCGFHESVHVLSGFSDVQTGGQRKNKPKGNQYICNLRSSRSEMTATLKVEFQSCSYIENIHLLTVPIIRNKRTNNVHNLK